MAPPLAQPLLKGLTMLPAHGLYTYISPDPLPAEAVELFGHDIQQAWNNHQPPHAPTQVCIGVTSDGQWLAGIWMELESLEQPAGAPEPVASIKHLIVSPAARGQGLAGRLLRQAINLAKDNHCARIRSTAGFGCPDHLAMYSRLSFATTASRELPYLVSKAL